MRKMPGARARLFSACKTRRKALDGRLAGLLDPDLMGAKARAEAEFNAPSSRASRSWREALAAYDKIAEATRTLAAQAVRAAMLESGAGSIARASASPARCCAPARSGPSPMASGCASSPIPARCRWNWPCSRKSRFTPIWKSSRWPTRSLSWPASSARDEPLVQKSARRQIAARPRGGVDQRHQGARRGVPQTPLRRRRGAVVAAQRSDDRTGAPGGSRGPGLAQSVRGTGRDRNSRPTPPLRAPATRCWATRAIPTPPSRCGCPSARSKATRRTASPCRRSPRWPALRSAHKR